MIFLGSLFLFISGCRSRSVQNSNDTGNNHSTSSDTIKNIGDPQPEYGANPMNWEEMEVPDEKVKSDTTQKDDHPFMDMPAYGTRPQDWQQTPATVDPQTDTINQEQHRPLAPVAAYGVNPVDYRIIPPTQ